MPVLPEVGSTIVPPGFRLAGGFRRFDHGKADAVLDRAAGIGALALHPDLVIGKQARQADVRRVADGGENALCLHGAGSLTMGLILRREGPGVTAVRETAGPDDDDYYGPRAAKHNRAGCAEQAGGQAGLHLAKLVRGGDRQADIEETRPRTSSGVLSWTSVLRMNTETMSAAPRRASMASDSGKCATGRTRSSPRRTRHAPEHLRPDIVRIGRRKVQTDHAAPTAGAARITGQVPRRRHAGCRARKPAAARSPRPAGPRTGRA
jgi:hypothetical protein